LRAGSAVSRPQPHIAHSPLVAFRERFRGEQGLVIAFGLRYTATRSRAGEFGSGIGGAKFICLGDYANRGRRDMGCIPTPAGYHPVTGADGEIPRRVGRRSTNAGHDVAGDVASARQEIRGLLRGGCESSGAIRMIRLSSRKVSWWYRHVLTETASLQRWCCPQPTPTKNSGPSPTPCGDLQLVKKARGQRQQIGFRMTCASQMRWAGCAQLVPFDVARRDMGQARGAAVRATAIGVGKLTAGTEMTVRSMATLDEFSDWCRGTTFRG